MTFKFSTVWTWGMCVVFFSFLAVHYAHMKSPGQYRQVASWDKPVVKAWYDCSFKM